MKIEQINNDITIINEDCSVALKTIASNSVDAIIVDLPYFKVVKDEFDNQWPTEEDYLDWVAHCLYECDRILKENGNILMFTSRQMSRYIANIAGGINGWEDIRTIIWARKRSFNTTRGKALASGYEPILHFCKGNHGTFNNIKIKVENDRLEYKTGTLSQGITLSDVWLDIPALPHNSKEKVAHPTQKPLALMERIVKVYTKKIMEDRFHPFKVECEFHSSHI